RAEPENTEEAADESANVDVFRLEAWMPQSIAAVKLRGFVDNRGEVSDSAPGYIRVRLKREREAVVTPAPTGLLARFGLGRKAEAPPEFENVDVDVFMDTPDASQPSKLLITVELHTPKLRGMAEAERWLNWCKQVQMDLAAYLMAKKVD